MGASSQYRPDTRAPGGGGMDYNGNPVGGGMGAQFNFGGPAQMPQPGFGRFQPRGMVPPAGARPQPGDMTGPYTRQRAPAGDPRRYGNPRQLNPGQGPLQPGVMPPGSIGQPGGPTPMPSPVFGRGKGGGGGKGGMPGPGGPVIDDMRYKGPPGGYPYDMTPQTQNPNSPYYDPNHEGSGNSVY